MSDRVQARRSGQGRWLIRYSAAVTLLWLIWVLLGTYSGIEHNSGAEFCAYVKEGELANWSASGQPCNLQWGAILRQLAPAPIVLLALLALPLPFWLWRRSRA